mmetsp:Transcript_11601/g.31590  ORF Transcript_11601/g.31590 Transcript_11601/m.31590 type:complete len:247 (-) Transcript_11601:3030-3770(-)
MSTMLCSSLLRRTVGMSCSIGSCGGCGSTCCCMGAMVDRGDSWCWCCAATVGTCCGSTRCCCGCKGGGEGPSACRGVLPTPSGPGNESNSALTPRSRNALAPRSMGASMLSLLSPRPSVPLLESLSMAAHAPWSRMSRVSEGYMVGTEAGGMTEGGCGCSVVLSPFAAPLLAEGSGCVGSLPLMVGGRGTGLGAKGRGVAAKGASQLAGMASMAIVAPRPSNPGMTSRGHSRVMVDSSWVWAACLA